MKTNERWDAFISHASEDKEFVKALVNGLEEWGLKVWFDGNVLKPGDSLRRRIDNGLASSDYGIVILSKSFFAKEWPKRELDGLTAREDGKHKVIIPIWHDVTSEQVRKYSPTLADRLSLLSSSEPETIAEKIVEAMFRDKFDKGGWNPIEYLLPDGTEAVVLPIHPHEGRVAAIAKHAVTNHQYRRFVDATGHGAPIGEQFVNGLWTGPFIPWDNPSFSDPKQPVTCVTFDDASRYCAWVNQALRKNSARDRQQPWSQGGDGLPMVTLPTTPLWEFAAYGTVWSPFNFRKRAVPLRGNASKSKSRSSPDKIDELGNRKNPQGVSDLFGNIWEWCFGDYLEEEVGLISLAGPRRRTEVQLRGGSFLDDLRKIRIDLPASILPDERSTRHSDLGFRIGAMIPINLLPKTSRPALAVQERMPRPFWRGLGV